MMSRGPPDQDQSFFQFLELYKNKFKKFDLEQLISNFHFEDCKICSFLLLHPVV
jgi:hypothetical protein